MTHVQRLWLLCLAYASATATPTFGNAQTIVSGNVPCYYTRGSAPGDFNGDGLLDFYVATANGGAGVPHWFALGNGDGSFGSRTDLALAGSYTHDNALQGTPIIGDFNADGNLDLVTPGNYGVTTFLYLNTGSSSAPFGTPLDVGVSSVNYAVYPGGSGAAVDLDGDSNLDLVLLVGQRLKRLMGNGDGTFGSAIDIHDFTSNECAASSPAPPASHHCCSSAVSRAVCAQLLEGRGRW